MKLTKIILSFVSALAILLSTSVTSFAKVVGDKIVLGSAISLTGKYSSNGVHTQNGYNWPLIELTAWVVLKLVEKLISLKSFIMMMSQTQKEQHSLQKD